MFRAPLSLYMGSLFELSAQLPLFFAHSQLETEQVVSRSSVKQRMLPLLQTFKADKGDNSNSKESVLS